MEKNVPETDDLIKFEEDVAPVKDKPEQKESKPKVIETPVDPAQIPDEQQARERNPVTGSGVYSDVRRTKGHSFNPNQGGNPITWEGYGDQRPRTPTQNSTGENVVNERKGRVPPGGWSSGLW